MHMNLDSNEVIPFTDSKDISTLRPSVLGTFKPDIKRTSYPELQRLQGSRYLALHVIAQAQGLSFMRYEYSRQEG